MLFWPEDRRALRYLGEGCLQVIACLSLVWALGLHLVPAEHGAQLGWFCGAISPVVVGVSFVWQRRRMRRSVERQLALAHGQWQLEIRGPALAGVLRWPVQPQVVLDLGPWMLVRCHARLPARALPAKLHGNPWFVAARASDPAHWAGFRMQLCRVATW